jgi:hypothetical protein
VKAIMMIRFFVVLIVVWGSACGGRASPLPSNRTVGSDLAALVWRADEALASTLRTDYQRPFLQKLPDLAWVSDRYLEACEAGDRRSCWLADGIRSSERAMMMVRSNCLAGDLMSCRALPEDQSDIPDRRLRGWAGRASTCVMSACEEARRQECTAGFPMSCLRNHTLDEEANARAALLTGEGCRAGILQECKWLTLHAPQRSISKMAYERVCSLSGHQCNAVASEYKEDPARARDALERGCQHTEGWEQDSMCVELIESYRDNLYQEPVPGRLQALIEWQCKKWGDDLGSCTLNVGSQQPASLKPP